MIRIMTDMKILRLVFATVFLLILEMPVQFVIAAPYKTPEFPANPSPLFSTFDTIEVSLSAPFEDLFKKRNLLFKSYSLQSVQLK